MDYLACHDIRSDWICDWVSQLVTFNHVILCLDSISFLAWFGLIISSSTTWSNWFQSGDFNKLTLIPYSLFLLNYLYSDVLPFNFCVGYCEIRSQPYYREYDWLGPYLTWNTRGCYILILPAFLIILFTVWLSF